jgi:hypothetical protein
MVCCLVPGLYGVEIDEFAFKQAKDLAKAITFAYSEA